MRLGDLNDLPQRKELAAFIDQNNIVDFSYVNVTKQHQAVGLIVNHQYCSLDELKSKIVDASALAKEYFYLAVNKFYVYSTVTNPVTTHTDYDSQLIEYCCKIIEHKFELLKFTTRNDDNGTLGNFLHPVTAMFFKRYE